MDPLTFLEVARRAPHRPPTVGRVPWSEVGEQRLTAALVHVDECLVQPRPVWWFDPGSGSVERGNLYGYRGINGTRRGLVVARRYAAGRADESVRWVAVDLITDRRE